MKLPTTKYPSGQEMSLSAFLLKMTSLDIRQARRISINRESSGVMDVRTSSRKRNGTSHNHLQEGSIMKNLIGPFMLAPAAAPPGVIPPLRRHRMSRV